MVLRWIARLVVLLAGLLHLAFAVSNFRPGFPKLEGVTAAIAGCGLIAAIVLTAYSPFVAGVVALASSLPFVVWFIYAVPETSDPIFLYGSLVVPVVSAAFVAVSVVRRRARY